MQLDPRTPPPYGPKVSLSAFGYAVCFSSGEDAAEGPSQDESRVGWGGYPAASAAGNEAP